jgi:aminoglycoside phosphotransferase (APT) family kinase protein
VTAAAPIGIDTDRLTAWFAASGIRLSGPLDFTLFGNGRSNLTYRIVDGDGHSYVLRRPPLSGVLESAHDVAREHRVISALSGTDVPVPTPFGLCTDQTVLGAPFFVMRFVEGVVLAGDAEAAALATEARHLASIDLVDVLVGIHRVDIDEIGLGSLGRKEDYVHRQLKRWHRQFHQSDPRDIPLIDELHARLSQKAPPQRYTGLVHGDYRPGNALFDSRGVVQAVLDWELTTLGDTLADVGWLLATWREAGEAQLLECPTAQPGFAVRTELLSRYGAASGHDLSDIGWYISFAHWRLACISEGVYARYRSGAMAAEDFDLAAQGDLVLRLAEASREALDGLS